jgi:hypothetical protein
MDIMTENKYQAQLIRRIERRLPGCVIFKMDAIRQGTPDLLILWNNSWAFLEVKAYADAPEQPNQEYYIHRFHEMSFASFIYPENEEDVLNALQQALESSGRSRIPQS